MELYIAGFDVACMWDNGAGAYDPPDANGAQKWHCSNCGGSAVGTVSDHMMLSGNSENDGSHLPVSQYRFNPVAHGMEMLSNAQNLSMLTVNSTGYRLHGFAGRDRRSGAVSLWLINKYNASESGAAGQKVRLTLPAGALAPTSIVSLLDDSADDVAKQRRWGSLTTKPLKCASGVCELVLPPLSFSLLKTTDDSISVSAAA